MNRELTKGNIAKTMLLIAFPMIAGNILQQFYNIVDIFIVGKFLETVGFSYYKISNYSAIN